MREAAYVVGFNLTVPCAFGRATGGAYGVVRHPAYLGAVLIWAGLSLCFLSAVGAAITVFYVVPVYLLYIRSEEAMMLECFGEEYRSYRRQVPMLLPRWRGRQA